MQLRLSYILSLVFNRSFVGSIIDLSTCIYRLLQNKMVHLGYPIYFLTILGVWKVLGVVAVLIPKFPLVKEWAYEGFFFIMSGAIISHLVKGDIVIELLGPTLLLILTVVSWYFRPAERKLLPINQ